MNDDDNVFELVHNTDKKYNPKVLDNVLEMLENVTEGISEDADKLEGVVMITLYRNEEGTSVSPSLTYVNMTTYELIGVFTQITHEILARYREG